VYHFLYYTVPIHHLSGYPRPDKGHAMHAIYSMSPLRFAWFPRSDDISPNIAAYSIDPTCHSFIFPADELLYVDIHRPPPPILVPDPIPIRIPAPTQPAPSSSNPQSPQLPQLKSTPPSPPAHPKETHQSPQASPPPSTSDAAEEAAEERGVTSPTAAEKKPGQQQHGPRGRRCWSRRAWSASWWSLLGSWGF
jgi:hypothetical protein